MVRFFLGPALALAGMFLAVPVVQAETWQHERGELRLAETPERVVALNWAATEALLLLGVTPVGMADRDGYPLWVQEPELPEGVHNVGTRSAPSLEAIAELKPDLIVTSGQLAPAWEQLRGIAPAYVVSVYDEGVEPFDRARNMLLTLGDILDREDRAQEALDELQQTLARSRRELERAGLTDKPIALVNFLDDRHVRINTPNGILQAALDGLGLENAWHKPGNFWGFSVVGLESLAALSEARIVAISPLAPGLAEQLADSPFWNHLPAVRNHEVYQIDPVWAYGGVYAVKRAAELLTAALLEEGRANVR